jgi:hypothetical protein
MEMTIGELKNLLEQFDDEDDGVVVRMVISQRNPIQYNIESGSSMTSEELADLVAQEKEEDDEFERPDDILEVLDKENRKVLWLVIHQNRNDPYINSEILNNSSRDDW